LVPATTILIRVQLRISHECRVARKRLCGTGESIGCDSRIRLDWGTV